MTTIQEEAKCEALIRELMRSTYLSYFGIRNFMEESSKFDKDLIKKVMDNLLGAKDVAENSSVD